MGDVQSQEENLFHELKNWRYQNGKTKNINRRR